MRNPIARYREWQTEADVHGSDLRDLLVALRNWTLGILGFAAFLALLVYSPAGAIVLLFVLLLVIASQAREETHSDD